MRRLVYVECACRSLIKAPFMVPVGAMYAHAITHHRPNNRNCRVLVRVWPDGETHVTPFPRSVPFENATLGATTERAA